MEKITITIPDNLTPEQELFAIVKKLGSKLLPSGTNKLLGNGYEIKDLQTAIIIKRKSTEKVTVTRNCPICATMFDHHVARPLWTNYGGVKKLHHYCSDECREKMMEICGEGRASIQKNKLKPLRTF